MDFAHLLGVEWNRIEEAFEMLWGWFWDFSVSACWELAAGGLESSIRLLRSFWSSKLETGLSQSLVHCWTASHLLLDSSFLSYLCYIYWTLQCSSFTVLTGCWTSRPFWTFNSSLITSLECFLLQQNFPSPKAVIILFKCKLDME